MRSAALLAAITVVALSCGGTASSGGHSPNPGVSSSALPTPSAYATPGQLSGSYGLILSAGQLELIRPNGSVAGSAPVAAPSPHSCSSAQDAANEAAPVSASSDAVYFRDGDTKIRMVVPPASATDITTVPGGPTTISFFSVSPDNQRIAVLVEDLSGTGPIKLRLYVEDLHGHTNHSDIYTTTTPRGNGTTLWPMGWHSDTLVLAVVPACSFEPAGLAPIEWHVSNAKTAVRIATIRSANCTFSFAPSPAGVGCMDSRSGVTTIYDWTGKVVSATGPGSTGSNYGQAGLSPAGQSIFFVVRPGNGSPPPATGIVQLGLGPYATVQGHAACAWIDETHLLAGDAVIQFPAGTAGNVRVTAKVTALAASGYCVGRFPGGL